MPAFKIPPAHSIVESTVVQVVAIFVWRGLFNSACRQRQRLRKILRRTAPASMPKAIIFQILPKGGSYAHSIVSFQQNFISFRRIGKPVLSIFLLRINPDFEGAGGLPSHYSLYELTGSQSLLFDRKFTFSGIESLVARTG